MVDDSERKRLEIGLTSKNPEVKIWQSVNIHSEYDGSVVEMTFSFKTFDTEKLLKILTSQEDSNINVRLSREV